MNKIILTLCFSLILVAHLYALSFTYEKKKTPPLNKPKFQKVSLQMARVEEPKPMPKQIVKEEPIVKKELFKKPIKKEAKRKLVKKVIKKKPKKKIIKKKEPKKEVVKKPVEKIVKKIEKKVEAPIKKKVKKAAKKDATQYLQKVKQYKRDYKTALRSAIDRNKKYPRASKKLKEQGKALVSFRILKTGLFQNIKLKASSGKKRLDKAALKALMKTAKFRAFPKELEHLAYLDLTLPVQFRIK